jgi:hypothetical protein
MTMKTEVRTDMIVARCGSASSTGRPGYTNGTLVQTYWTRMPFVQ